MTKRHAARTARSSVRAACPEDIGLTNQPTNSLNRAVLTASLDRIGISTQLYSFLFCNLKFEIMFRFVKRSLTKKEAHVLVEEIKMTPNITGYSLDEWLQFETVLIAIDSKQNMLGVCLYYDMNCDFTFISVLFVLEEFRGRGIGKELFYQACNDILNCSKNIYTASRNASIIKIMNEQKFITFDALFNLPESYQRYKLDFIIHILKWSTSFYRIKEMIRKLSKYRSPGNFIYGIRDYRQ